MSLDREFNSRNFDTKFVPKFDLDHPKSQIGPNWAQISSKNLKFKFEILKFSKPICLGRELNFWNFGTKFMPNFNSEGPEIPI